MAEIKVSTTTISVNFSFCNFSGLASCCTGPLMCTLASRNGGGAKGVAKASCGEAVVQKGVFGESVSSLPP